jgi:hypothetical protein
MYPGIVVMTPQLSGQEFLDEIYGLLLTAASRKQPIAALYDGLPRLLCPHVLGRNKEGSLRAFCYQFGGSSGSGLRSGPEGLGEWRCLAVDKLSLVELAAGAWRTEPRSSRQHCVEKIDFDVEAQLGDNPQ